MGVSRILAACSSAGANVSPSYGLSLKLFAPTIMPCFDVFNSTFRVAKKCAKKASKTLIYQ
jgi:hypothetical protein